MNRITRAANRVPGGKRPLTRATAVIATLMMVLTALAITPAAAQVDTTSPTRPGYPTDPYTTINSDKVIIRWSGSTDNVGVTGYRIELGDRQSTLGPNNRALQFNAVAPGRYISRVYALDAAGNESLPRIVRVRVMTAAQQTVAVNRTDAIADAIEDFIADGNDFDDLGGYNNQGSGWFDLNYVGGSQISATLINGGYLDPIHDDDPFYDFMIAQCGSGGQEYAGVFSFIRSDAAPAPSGPFDWSGCTNTIGFKTGHLHYATTQTISVLRGDTVDPTRPALASGPYTEADSNSVTVRWGASSDNVGVASYRVRVGSTQAIVDAATLEHTFTGISNGRHVTRVYARDAVGNESLPRVVRVRVMNQSQQTDEVVRTTAIADAIEDFIADGNEFNDLGGYNNQGHGWFDLAYGGGAFPKMSATLIDGGYLDEVHDDGPFYDFMIYQCGTGDDEYSGVFSLINEDIAPAPGGPYTWDGCTTAPFKNAHHHYVTTRTIGEIQAPPGNEIVEVRVAVGTDDVEERTANGSIYVTSTDLELTQDGVNAQIAGMRFLDVGIPPGATIVDAWIEFEVDEVTSGATSLTIRAEDIADAAPFTTAAYDVSSRTLTTASTPWNPPAWNAANAKKVTPSLNSMVQELVDRSDWLADNSMVFVVSGSGSRIAESADGEPANAPLLHVEYTPPVVETNWPFEINEVYQQGPWQTHWVELLNTSDLPASLDGYEMCTMYDCGLVGGGGGIPVPPLIGGGGLIVLQYGDISFTTNDRLRLYGPDVLGRTLLDEYTWSDLAATSYGRCPDGQGPMRQTAVVTQGTANECLPTSGAWPGTTTVTNGNQVSGNDWSGAGYEPTGATTGYLWMTNNGTSEVARVNWANGNWGSTATTWTVPGNYDTEAITPAQEGDSVVYLGIERDGDASGTPDNKIVRFDTANNATTTWDLTERNGVAANKGIEGLTWIPDSSLGALTGYDPAAQGDHQGGLFVIGQELTSTLWFYALDHTNGTYNMVYEVDSGLNRVMSLEWDASTGTLWVTCDDSCGSSNRVSALHLNQDTGEFTAEGVYGVPSSQLSNNNEGFTVLPITECSGGTRPVIWTDDNGSPAVRRLATTIGC